MVPTLEWFSGVLYYLPTLHFCIHITTRIDRQEVGFPLIKKKKLLLYFVSLFLVGHCPKCRITNSKYKHVQNRRRPT
jgi:hypothetical protein